MSSERKKSQRQRRHERVSMGGSKFAINLTVNAMLGIMLAILGTFILFFSQDVTLLALLIRIIGVIAVCLGAVAVVNYFRHKNSGASLVVGILQIVIGVGLLIAASQIAQWIFLALGICLAAYGVYLLITSRGNTLTVLLGVAFIVLGVLIILYTFNWEWVNVWGKYIIGVAAYLGAIAFLFF